jgi:hypothetical protein
MGDKIRNGYRLLTSLNGAYRWCLALQAVAKLKAAERVIELVAQSAAHIHDEAQITGKAVPRFLGDTATASLHRQYRKAHRSHEAGFQADVETTVLLWPQEGAVLMRLSTQLDIELQGFGTQIIVEPYSYDEVNGPEEGEQGEPWRRRGKAWAEARETGPALRFQCLGYDGFPFPKREAVIAAIPSLEQRARKAGLDLLQQRCLEGHVGEYTPEDAAEFWRWLHTAMGERKLEEARAQLLTTLVNPFPVELLYPPEAR